MKLHDNIDFTALNWVKHELDVTLKQGRDALEAYVENPSDVALMRESALHLHQVQGTLRMVELYGAAMAVEEMERLAQGLLNDTVKQRDEAYSVLMRGMVQLPDYLERVQSGHKDIPIVLLPLLNDLRACRGDNLLTESALFSPDMLADLPLAAIGSRTLVPAAELRTQALRLRLGFQAALLKWFRDESAGEHLDRLNNVLDRLRTISHGSEPRRLWWVAGGVIEAVRDGTLEPSVAVKLLFGGVDREIKHFADGGEDALTAKPPRDLVKNLLYYIAHSTAQGPRAHDVRATYRLDTLLPTQKELQHAQGSMTGHNRNLLDTVSVAIKDDLLRVKESLDIFLRSSDANPADLASQAEILDRVGDTLGMLGLGMPRKVVGEQRTVIEEMSDNRRPIDEGALLDVAGALLYVEASLDDHIERLGAGGESEHAEGELELPKAEVRKILDALMREAAVNIQQAKHDIIAFIESPWEHARVEQIPRLLEEISGALRMLGLGDAAQLMTGIVRFVETELLQHRRVPTAEQMDKLADALAAIEYYLEATREQRGNRERILNVTRESLESLGYWPVPSGGGGSGADVAPIAPLPASHVEPPAPPSAEASALEAAASLAYGNDSTNTATSTMRERSLHSLSFEAPSDQFPSWGDHLPSGRSDGLRDEGAERLVADPNMPSIDLPNIDLDVDLSAPAWNGDSRDSHASNDAPGDVPSVVEIAPGRDIGDLIVGESNLQEPFAHDLDGLRLAETGEMESGWTEIEEEIEEEVPLEAAHDAGFQSTAGDDIDDDIREVFVEEVQEEIENMRRQLPIWKADIENLESLKPLRRSFHTLKGSGRLVGALTLGEFSWKVENMLNRVLDRTIVPGHAAVSLVEHAVDALPELLGALRGGSAPMVNVHGIMHTADRVAAGEDAHVPARHTATRKVRRTVRRRVPIAATDAGSPSGDFDIESAFGASPPEIHAGPTPNIDPVLFDILKSEVAAHLGVIGDYLDRCADAPVVASEALLRAVHTLNGAIAMVDLPALGHVLAPLEGYIKRLRGVAAAPDDAGIVALEGTVKLARDVITRLDMGMSSLPDSSDLAQRVTALRDALPEPESSLHLYSGSDAAAKVEDVAVEEPVQAASSDEIARHHLASAVADEDLTHTLVQAFQPDNTGTREESAFEMPADLAASLSAFEIENPSLSDAAQAAEAPVVAEDEASEPAFSGLPAFVDAALVGALSEADKRDSAEHPDGPYTANVYVPDDEVPAVAFEADETEDLADLQSLDDPAEELVLASTPEEESEEVVMSIGDEPLPAATSRVEPVKTSSAPMREPVRAVDRLTGAEAPPIAEDAQPDGALELPDMDDDLLGIFVQEGADILDHSDSLMARLREAPSDRDLIVGLQRDLHTLKGGARMAGLAPIGDLSHAMESLIDIVSEGRRPMDRVAVESLERGFDRLHALVQRVAQRQAIAMPLNAIARFEGLVAGELPADIAVPIDIEEPATSDAQAESIAPIEQAQVPQRPPVQLPTGPRPAPRHLPTFDEEDAPRAPQEMIRVRSELLDSLVNYAGEVSIYRSRLEQQISTFRFNLIEFEQTVSRLREQLRKLEIETEAQIIARYQREHHEPGQVVFDPLELDRFSQLQQLSRALGESVSDLVSIQGLLDDLTRQSETLLLQQSRVSSDLQEGLMRTRMVPFDSLVPNLRRTLRQAAQELGKRAQLRVDGAQGEMDRNLLERMKAPFEHMLRNALAHGIETPEERLSAGKPAEGTVNIAVSREATEVVLRVSDDGHGMDREAIRLKAIERGLLKPDVELSDRDLYGFVLETGFSTAEQVTQLSGRGVGMDVVHNEIKQLGGSLLIDSEQGKGATFTIRLPFTLAVTQAILVKLGDNTYAIPMSSVQGVVRMARDDLDRRLAMGNPKYSYAGEEFNIYELSQLLGVPAGRALDETQLPLLMTRTGDQRAAVRIDAVVGSREIVVKSVGPQISSVPGIFGATIMGDGSVVMILDLAPLVRRSAALRARGEGAAPVELPVYSPPAVVQEQRRHPLIMVVDDSITMRKVTTRVLERAELDVITAKDGLDAVEKLQEKVPDLMLLDIEMPRMDGYELATYMRNDARLKDVPIIMVTSRTGEKHRQRALEIGVERYLGKPYQEADLLRHVQEILRLDRV
ncbi:MAG TPA: Hpt domain-containing protein [Rhodanobacteraceae bacterium]|jgi:chemosensory pili system protein ChpA (sensor histidine kinase/response regulator)|nr:Hpt domain-containing protein [Rhodanobacteraceae bacterium]